MIDVRLGTSLVAVLTLFHSDARTGAHRHHRQTAAAVRSRRFDTGQFSHYGYQPRRLVRPFLYLGVSEDFTYDLAKTIVAGDSTSVTVSNLQLNGVALNPAAAYNVTVNNFLADGGDNFITFGTLTASRLDGGNDLQALVNTLGRFS